MWYPYNPQPGYGPQPVPTQQYTYGNDPRRAMEHEMLYGNGYIHGPLPSHLPYQTMPSFPLYQPSHSFPPPQPLAPGPPPPGGYQPVLSHANPYLLPEGLPAPYLPSQLPIYSHSGLPMPLPTFLHHTDPYAPPVPPPLPLEGNKPRRSTKIHIPPPKRLEKSDAYDHTSKHETVESSSGKGKCRESPTLEATNKVPAANVQDRVPKFSWEKDLDSWWWPNGDHSRRILWGENPPINSLKFNQWAWRSTGNDARGRAVSRCLGVFRCKDSLKKKCKTRARPKTQRPARDLQLQEPCPGCGGEMVLESCNTARCYFYLQSQHDQVYAVWEHIGEHLHERPPVATNSPENNEEVQTLVSRHRNATAHEFRTGTGALDSKPLWKINPRMTNPDVARYEVRKARKALGLVPLTTAKGFFSSLEVLQSTLDDLGKPFLLNSALHQPAVHMAFQTPWMRETGKESIRQWIEEDEAAGPTVKLDIIGRHGFVTDGDHTFMLQGVLIATCVFALRIRAWTPILYTWIQRQDMEHHRPHFQILFEMVLEVLKELGKPLEGKYLTNVMDFSGSQRSAYTEEYADIMMTTLPATISHEARHVQRQAFLEEAKKAVVGCHVHFARSALRVKQDGSLVPVDLVGEFDRLHRTLTSWKITLEEYQTTVDTFRRTFPNLKHWLNWWLRPDNAAMIFPAVGQRTEEMAAQVPSTSNPVEHSHALLHHAVGKDNDLIPAIQKLFEHVSEFEARDHAVQEGHYRPREPPQSHRLPREKKFERPPDSERPPDTAEALHDVEAQSVAATKHKLGLKNPQGASTPLTQAFASEYLNKAYKWLQPNSCFWDHGMELLFRAFQMVSPSKQQEILAHIPTASVLSGMYHHFSRRIRLLEASDTSLLDIERELGLGQATIKRAIFHVLHQPNEFENENDYGCACTWIARAIKNGTDERTQAYFGINHCLNWRCSECGQTECTSATQQPEESLTFHRDDLQGTRQRTQSDDIDANDCLSRYIPRRRVGPQKGTTVLHLLSKRNCLECRTESLALETIETSWPEFLQVFPENVVPTLEEWKKRPQLRFPRSLMVGGVQGKNLPESQVSYTLVGRVLSQPQHFTAELYVQDKWHTYNDMFSTGLLPLKDQSHSESHRLAYYYLYVRTSTCSTSIRTCSDLHKDYYEAPEPVKPRFIEIPSDNETSKSLAEANASERDASVASDSSDDDLDDFQDGASSKKDGGPDEKASKSLPQFLSQADNLKNKPRTMVIVNCSACKSPLQKMDEEDADLNFELVKCAICNEYMHEKCMRLGGHLTFAWENVGIDKFWGCPDCLGPEGLWDKRILGRFLLFPLQEKESLLFPAKVTSRSKKTAHLVWYEGNVYEGGYSQPKVLTFTKSLEECYQAYEEAQNIHYLTKSRTCRIYWPLRLAEDAAELHHYRHKEVEWVLNDAKLAVMEILMGKRPHPIFEDLTSWMKRFNSKHSNRMQWELSFTTDHFTLYTFLGDDSLASEIINEVIGQVDAFYKSTDSQPPQPRRLMIQLASILLRLALTRYYLCQPPEHDQDIYRLTTAQYDPPFRLQQSLTPPEQALAAIRGSHDTQSYLPPQFFPSRIPSLAPFQIDESIPQLVGASPVTLVEPPGTVYVWNRTQEMMLSATGSQPPITITLPPRQLKRKRGKVTEDVPRAGSRHSMTLRQPNISSK